MEPGAQLGHYTVLSEIGRGGMGVVWKAKDNKLGREVAIKTLPPEFAQDAERLARFEREARLLASLNHPNIAAIHGFEEIHGTHFLVLELVEGDTLADRLRGGAIPVEESLKLALQIAEALEAAHGKGVVHRDLKPANIKVTDDDKVKVLDFGLAKALGGGESEAAPSNSPTLSMQATQQGVILGTAAYMSPEQAKGKSTDKRTDIWAFGCVLFEMLAGRAAFQGEDVTDILGSVLKLEPAWEGLPPNLHPRINETLERCLTKTTKHRYQDIGDVREEIERALADPDGLIARAEPEAAARVVEIPVPQPKLPWVAAVVVGVVITGVGVWVLKPEPAPDPVPVARSDYDLPEGTSFRNIGVSTVAVSRDGQYTVYNGTGGMYLRSRNELEARLIAGTEGDVLSPFFSPDGEWLGFWRREGRIEKIAISGGSPVLIGPAPSNPFGIHWGVDEMVLFQQPDGIYSVSANGGTPERIIESVDGEVFSGPTLLPDGRGVLFTVGAIDRWDNGQIVVVDPANPDERQAVWAGSAATYLPTGHLLYALGSDLFAIAFDLETLTTSGTAVSLEQGLARALGSDSANYGVSNDGTLVYRAGGFAVGGAFSLAWVDRQGQEEAIGAEPRSYQNPRISPDGERVALDTRNPRISPDGERVALDTGDEQNDIMVWDFTRETLSRFTPTEEREQYPVWSPNGERIAYGGSGTSVLWKAADGSGVAEAIFEGETESSPYFFSPSGSELVFRAVGRNADDIGMFSINGESEPTWLLETEFQERNAELSPDGNWMAYESNETGNPEIYVSPFPNTDEGKQQVSSNGGRYPLWSRDGRELFYTEQAAGAPPRLMAVPVETEPAFDWGAHEAIFDWQYRYGTAGRPYDVSPDGQRFLVIPAVGTAGDDAPAPRIITVLNWFEELKQRVPVE